MADTKLILEAISRMRCMEAIYNRVRMKLAPHILYTRHGDLFLDAVAVEREGRTPGRLRLGTFKIAGLQVTELVARSFQPLPGFNAGDLKYMEATPFAISG